MSERTGTVPKFYLSVELPTEKGKPKVKYAVSGETEEELKKNKEFLKTQAYLELMNN